MNRIKHGIFSVTVSYFKALFDGSMGCLLIKYAKKHVNCEASHRLGPRSGIQVGQ